MIENDLNRRDFVKIGAGMVSAIALAPGAMALMNQIESDEPLPVGVIGVGKQGRVIIGELQKFPFVQVACVCESNERRLKSAKRRAKGATGYTDYREMLDKESGIKAVFLATPSHLHKEIALEVMGRGVHLYCEAPLATTVEDAKVIALAAKNAKGLFHVGLQLRANPIYSLARSFVRSGAIQDIIALRAQYHRKSSGRVPAPDSSLERAYNWSLYKESSIGLEGEKGIHSFDAINWFTRKRPLSVAGWGGIMLYDDGREIPDTVQCVLTYPDQVRLMYDATLANSFDGVYEQFTGTMGTVKMIGDLGWMFKEADASTQGWEVYAVRQHFHKEEGITLIANATKLAKQGKLKEGVGLEHPALYYGLHDFLAAIVEAKTSTACPAMVGLEATVIAVKAHEAVMENKEIKLLDEWFELS